MEDRARSTSGVRGSARKPLKRALLWLAVAGTVAAGFAFASARSQARTRVSLRVDPGYMVTISLPEHYRDETGNDRNFCLPHILVKTEGNPIATRVDWLLNRTYSTNVRPPTFILMATDLSKQTVPVLVTDSDGYVMLSGKYPGKIVNSWRNAKCRTANVSVYELQVPSAVTPRVFVLFVNRLNSRRAFSISAAVPEVQGEWMHQRMREIFNDLQLTNICGYPEDKPHHSLDDYINTKPSS